MSSLQPWSAPDFLATLLGGRYRLIRLVAESSTAAVYLAEHLRLGKQCALKVIAPHLLADPAATERFGRDLFAAAPLIHPHIVQVYDYDRVDGLHFIALEYIDGSTLADVLAAGAASPVEPRQVLGWAEQIGSALAYAHGAGVIHRHLGPDNILIDKAGAAHIINFADAKLADRENDRLRTQAGMISIDAPEYLSPEQVLAEPTSPATDQYALGVVLFTLLAGQPPFSGPALSVLHQHVSELPPDLRALRPDLAPEMEAAIRRMLAKDPHLRFPSALEAVAAIRADPALDPLVGGARPPGARPKQDVRFTVYRPRSVRPERWYKLAVFAHASDASIDPRHGQTAEERVRVEANQLLGSEAAAYGTVSEDSAVPIARESQLLFVPHVDGFRFSPPHITVDWIDDVERAIFNIMADASLDGNTARGRLNIFNGPVLLADMALVIRVGEEGEQTTIESVPAYRKVFVSYSRKDEFVVRQLEAYARAIGDQYIRDINALHAGERWDDRLLELIEAADVFQLFWSWNSLRSPHVEREWRHALALGRPNFVRPFYWESPFPEDGERPPGDLRALNFQRVELAAPPAGKPPAPAPQQPPAAAGEFTVTQPGKPAQPPAAAAPRGSQIGLSAILLIVIIIAIVWALLS